jgi:hypothetical protein
MEENQDTFERLLSVMPAGWKEHARTSGALVHPREIRTPEDLLKLIFLYVTQGRSLGNTSVLFSLSGQYHLGKTAVHKRIGNSAAWLQWLCEHFCRNTHLLREKPSWLADRDVCMVDASDESVFGSTKADFRLHYALSLFDLATRELRLTDTKEGEKLSNFQNFTAGDIVMGDRAYGTIAGMEYVRERGCDFVLRLRTKAFIVYDAQKQEVDVLAPFHALKAGESGSYDGWYLHDGAYHPVRLCAVRKSAEAEKAGLRRLETEARRKGRGEVSAAQKAYNRYVVVATSLTEVEGAAVLELYRQRWQVELVFKRLKSLFGYNEIPVKLEKTARAWFYAKLVLAAFCETLVNQGRFSPSTEQNAGETVEYLARTGAYAGCGDGSTYVVPPGI